MWKDKIYLNGTFPIIDPAYTNYKYNTYIFNLLQSLYIVNVTMNMRN